MDNNNGMISTINNEVENEEFVEDEKKGFFANAKEAVAGKWSNFEDDHPKGAKAIKRIGKAAKVIGLVGAGIFVGNAIAHKEDDLDWQDLDETEFPTNEEDSESVVTEE